MGMEDSRVSSAKNSRRRRWEVKTKESFETSLAIEIEDSPAKKETAVKFQEKDSTFPSEDDTLLKEKTSKTSEDYGKDSAKAEKHPKKTSSSKPSSATSKGTKPAKAKTSSATAKPSSATAKPSSAKSKPSSAKSKPSSAKSKPSSAKSVTGSKATKTEKPLEDNTETDLLSAKLGALIDEASVKSKDSQRRSAKEKGKIQSERDDVSGYDSNDSPVSHSPEDSPPLHSPVDSLPLHSPDDSSPPQSLEDSPPLQSLENNPSAYTVEGDLDYTSKGVLPVDPSKDNYFVHASDDALAVLGKNDGPVVEVRKVKESVLYTDDPPKYTEKDDTMYLNDSSPEPSAPPLSSVSPSPEWIPKRKKTKSKKSESQMLLLNTANEESFISLQLKELKDDVVDITEDPRIVASPGLLRTASLPTVQGNINAVFEERIGGFVMTRQDDDGSPKKSERLQDATQVKTRTSHAVFLQSGFRTFSVLCQGLLAGLTLAHCLLIFLLETDPAKLPAMYNSRMAHIFYALIIFLTTICFTSACDRCDLSGIGVLSGHGLKIPWTPAFYLSSLALSLVAIRTEDVLAYGISYQGILHQSKVDELVSWWRWICVARSSTALLAWLAVVPDPHTDALLDSIQELDRK
ncbi:nucleolar protein dao-5-like [Macrobrachium rosenbergii]|uniref:nucleolar protein dao-5-like n=1 Tax=Macrobrachium rosenbergii TaxID=79674 RepID=UPI0034D4E6E6